MDSRNLPFYRGIKKSKKGHSLIFFLSETAMSKLKITPSIEILMDGMKFIPRHLKFTQLYIMSFMCKGRSYPFGYIFMEKRDCESYDCLFETLATLWGDVVMSNVVHIMTDYEKAVRKSIKKNISRKQDFQGGYLTFM